MTESTTSVESDQSKESSDLLAQGSIDASELLRPSVRDLLAELARLEDATRAQGGARRPTWTVQTPDLLAALAREQEIIDELHRRCPAAKRCEPQSPDVTEGAQRAD